MNLVAQGILDQLKAPDRRDISAWAVGNVVLPHSKRAREWSEDTAYWLIEPLNAIPHCEAVSVCKPTQTGGTTLYEVFLTWLVANAPSDAALMGQTDSDAEYLFRAKLLPTLKTSPATAALLKQVHRNDVTKNRLDLGSMSLRIHGPGKNSMQSASLEVILLDEAWLFPLGTILEILERTSTREATRKIVTVSQAGEELLDKKRKPQWDEWGQWWHRGTQEVFQACCPYCGSYFEPTTACFKHDPEARDVQTKDYDWTKVRETTHLETPCCKKRINNDPRNRRSLSASGKYVQTNPNPSPRHRSFRYSSWVVYWQDWGSLLEQFLRAKEALKSGNIESLKIWTQKKEARWWTVKDQEIPSFKERKLFGYKMEDYKEGQIYEGSIKRLISVDMQADCYKLLIRDFKLGGGSRLIFQKTVKDWTDIAYYQTVYRIKPFHVAIDAGNWSQAVYKECADRQWIALVGSGTKAWSHIDKATKQQTIRPYSPARQGRVASAPRRAEWQGGRKAKPVACWYYEWSNLYFKDWLSRLAAGQGVEWEYADDVEQEYIWSLDSEARRIGPDGKPKWQRIGNRANHYWDCECMILVLASIIGGVFVDVPQTDEETGD